MSKKKPAAASETSSQEAPATGAKKAVTANRKLTVKDICGKLTMAWLIDALETAKATEIKLCKIVGYASGVKTGTTSFGDWYAVTGEFAGTNYETGEIFIAKTAIIPGAMGDAIVDTVTEKLTEDAGSKVAFAVDIYVKRSPRNPDEKYEYIVRPLMDAQISSPAMALLEMSETLGIGQ